MVMSSARGGEKPTSTQSTTTGAARATPSVTVLATSAGWLRFPSAMRSIPGTSDDEQGQRGSTKDGPAAASTIQLTAVPARIGPSTHGWRSYTESARADASADDRNSSGARRSGSTTGVQWRRDYRLE